MKKGLGTWRERARRRQVCVDHRVASLKNVKGCIVQALSKTFTVILKENIDCFQYGFVKQS